jgi:hypothetical protein
VIVIVLLTAIVAMVGCNTCSICGVYLAKDDPNVYIEFLSDGTFNFGGLFTGHWYADGNKITVTIPLLGSGTGMLKGNIFTDSDGRIWVKSGK